MTHPLGIDPAEFPIVGRQIYLNHAGVSPLPHRAAEMMRAYTREAEEEAGTAWPAWARRMKTTRAEAAKLLGSHSDEIAFVKSTTAGLNAVAMGLAWKAGDVIVVEENTFPANWHPWKFAEAAGAKLWVWPERNHGYDLAELEARLRQGGVRLIAATSANYATGWRQDLAAIGRLCRAHDALFCVDAIQTLGVFPTNVEELAIDFLSADSHKWLLGPEGAGLMYVRRERLALFSDAGIGWLGRENHHLYHRLDLPPDPTARRFEEGAPNVAGFTAMGASLELLNGLGADRIAAHNRALCAVLEDGLVANGWILISPHGGPNASSIVSATNPTVNLDTLTAKLWREEKIFAAARRGFLRLSPHCYQTAQEMATVVEKIAAMK